MHIGAFWWWNPDTATGASGYDAVYSKGCYTWNDQQVCDFEVNFAGCPFYDDKPVVCTATVAPVMQAATEPIFKFNFPKQFGVQVASYMPALAPGGPADNTGYASPCGIMLKVATDTSCSRCLDVLGLSYMCAQ
jgi:hypothetical protein